MPAENKMLSSKHLTHKFASFHGCTLDEMGLILGIYAAVEIPVMLILSMMTKHYLGGFIGALLLYFLFFAMLTFFVLLKKTATYIGNLRKDKSPGFLTLRFKQICHTKFNLKIPYVTRSGLWQTRRHI